MIERVDAALKGWDEAVTESARADAEVTLVALCEALAPRFEERLHPRNRLGKFRDVIDSLQRSGGGRMMSPGTGGGGAPEPLKFTKVARGHYATADGRYALVQDGYEPKKSIGAGDGDYEGFIGGEWAAVYDARGRMGEDPGFGANLDWKPTKREAEVVAQRHARTQVGAQSPGTGDPMDGKATIRVGGQEFTGSVDMLHVSEPKVGDRTPGGWTLAGDTGSIKSWVRPRKAGGEELMMRRADGSYILMRSGKSGRMLSGVETLRQSQAEDLLNGDSPAMVNLIGYGNHPAKPAGDLKVGERIAYNYGSTAEVIRVEPRGMSVRLTVRDRNGKEYTSTRRASTMVAWRPAAS